MGRQMASVVPPLDQFFAISSQISANPFLVGPYVMASHRRIRYVAATLARKLGIRCMT
jgi:hypothetical protein